MDPAALPCDNQSQVQTQSATPKNGIPAPGPLETTAEEVANLQTVSAAPEIKQMAFAAGAEGHGLPVT